MVPLTLVSGNFDQLKDFKGFEGCGTFLICTGLGVERAAGGQGADGGGGGPGAGGGGGGTKLGIDGGGGGAGLSRLESSPIFDVPFTPRPAA